MFEKAGSQYNSNKAFDAGVVFFNESAAFNAPHNAGKN